MMFKRPLLLFFLVAAVYLLAIPVDTMDVDASQYASMSREMKESGSYLQVYEQGKDYLDKPPFLFWISSVSMLVLGENNFAFKFPSILFALLALFATWRLARLYYDKERSCLAALVLASSQALFLITNDIKTDTILMGWVTLALWQLARWMQTDSRLSFFTGCAAIAFGMMTKGPIALLVPVFALGSQVVLQRNWRYLWRPVYLPGLLLIAVLLLPMSIGLYQQFDLHPEKLVNGKQGVSGLRFFYWTQSFGRITGESVWNNGASFTFLLENLLWAWLPWTLFLLVALVTAPLQLIRQGFRLHPDQEVISTGGFLITYCSLALSKFQLPHYIYVVLPLAAILTSGPLQQFLKGHWKKWALRTMQVAQGVVLLVLVSFPVVLLMVVFPEQRIWPWALALLAVLLPVVNFA
ncbi:MAG TPA: glycosyltransferase family 39 protein [Lacibacter sp.]|nr:glycosyltransferase family 39 protein [Lacibacter sp.]